MEVSEQKLPENPFYVGRHSLIRIVFLAADDTQANELWFLGSAIELQEELFLGHCRQVRFDLGDEIHFRQLAMKIVAIESAPLFLRSGLLSGGEIDHLLRCLVRLSIDVRGI